MNWKKALRITAMTVIPGGLVALGTWAVVKKLRSKSREAKNAKTIQQHAKEETKHDVHSVRNQ